MDVGGGHGDRSSVAAEIREVAPEEPLPRLPLAAFRAREDALSIEHRMTHFPKSALCDVCNRAKLFSKRVRSRRAPDPESDLPDPTVFVEQIALDHMVVSKSSSGKEFVVLMQAYPATTKDASFVQSCLLHFVGVRKDDPIPICRSDCAQEILRAIRELGWLPESSLPKRWPHNSILERVVLLRSAFFVFICRLVSQ